MNCRSKITFRRFGRSYHLGIADSDDLATVLELDEAHGVATGAPISTLRGDPTFLRLLDTDNNGRIRTFELEAAILWLGKQLRDMSGVTARSDVLRRDAINTDNPEENRIANSVTKMLARVNQGTAVQIDLDQI